MLQLNAQRQLIPTWYRRRSRLETTMSDTDLETTMCVTETYATHDVQRLEDLLTPVNEQLSMLREKADIIIVVHRPTPLALKAFKLLGMSARPGTTSTFGVSCRDAMLAFGHDPVTRKWASTPPAKGCMKILFFGGEGSCLLHRYPGPEGARLVLTPDFDIFN